MVSFSKKQSITIKFSFVIIYTIAICLVLYFVNQLNQLLYEPLTTPEEWCVHQPCHQFTLFGNSFVFVQPMSTFFVYLLGLIGTGIGIYLLVSQKNQKSARWWGIALILWGLGALSAGTSYQAFSYEIKCAGKSFCNWTSLWEIFYLLLSVGSVNAMMMSQVYSSSTEKWQKFQLCYAPINMVVYTILVVIGSIIHVRFMVSFELMVLFLLPSFLMFFANNTRRYIKHKNRDDLMLLWVWLGLGIIMILYYLYYLLGLTEKLWDQGIWFSDNDILHIGLIMWMIYIGIIAKKYVRDAN